MVIQRTEEDFNATIKLMKKLNILIHSPLFLFRLGTPAAELNKIDDSIAKKDY